MTRKISVSLNEEEAKKLDDFIVATNKILIEEQKKNSYYQDNIFAQECWEMGYPYLGASGGGLTYKITPTTIGTVIVVDYMGHQKDVTDYSSW